MLITLQLTSLDLDFELDGEKSIPLNEQRKIIKEQLLQPVTVEPNVTSFRELFCLDDIQDQACDVISERSGYFVKEFSFV